MTDFNPEVVAQAARKIKELTGEDIIAGIREDEITRRVKVKLADPAFVCEAFSEMPAEEHIQIGTWAAKDSDMAGCMLGAKVGYRLLDYAKKIVQQDILWDGWDAQREFEQSLRDDELDAARDYQAEVNATRKPE